MSIARHCGEYVHLKTAGTSWGEALRVIAQCEPALFREILAFALDCYPTDRASYHVSAVCERVSYDLDDAGLPGLLDHFDARQALHVTFGSVLDRFREPIYAALSAHEDTYYEVLRQHFNRHIGPFVAPA